MLFGQQLVASGGCHEDRVLVGPIGLVLRDELQVVIVDRMRPRVGLLHDLLRWLDLGLGLRRKALALVALFVFARLLVQLVLVVLIAG